MFKKVLAIAAFAAMTLVPFAGKANAQPAVSGTFVGPHGTVTFSNGDYCEPRNDFGYSTYYSRPRYSYPRYGYAGYTYGPYYRHPRGHWEYQRVFIGYPFPHYVTRRVWVSYRCDY